MAVVSEVWSSLVNVSQMHFQGHGGLYHSQSPEGFFMGASGLKVLRRVSFEIPTSRTQRLNLDCDSSFSHPSQGFVIKFNTRSQSRHFYGTQDFISFSRLPNPLPHSFRY